MSSQELSLDGGRTVLDARNLDRVLAYIDGALPAAEADRLLNELSPSARTRLRAMRADAQVLRSSPAPEAPEELHEAVMSAAERAELFAHNARTVGFDTIASPQTAAATGVIARPWSMRWSRALSAAAVIAMGVGVVWMATRSGQGPTPPIATESNVVADAGPDMTKQMMAELSGGKKPEISVVSASDVFPTPYVAPPVAAPYAVVLEYDDPDEAQAALLSAMGQQPEAHLTTCCRNQCTEIVMGPPHFIEEPSAEAELVPVAEIPSHQMVVPAADLGRILSTLVGKANGWVDQRRIGLEGWPPKGATSTVELPIFIVPASR